MMIMEAFFYVLQIMAIKFIKHCEFTCTGSERELISGLPTTVNSDDDQLNLHSLSTGKSISKMIKEELKFSLLLRETQK